MNELPRPSKITVERALSKAKKAVKRGNFSRALELYAVVLEQDPYNPVAKKSVRRLQKQLANTQDKPTEPLAPSQEQLDEVLSLYHSNQPLEAERACTELLADFPHSVDLMNLLGVCLLSQGKLENAVAVYDKIIHLMPEYAVAYCNKGVALKAMGNFRQALESYDQAIRFDPQYVDAYTNRGVVLQELEQLDDALSSLDTAIKLAPENPKAFYNRGNVFRVSGKLKEAVSDYDEAIRLAPNFPEAFCNRGSTFVDMGEYEKALESYRKAALLRPDYAEVYFSIGNVSKLMGYPEKALQNYDLAIEQHSTYADAYCNRGVVLVELSRFKEALGSYDQAIAIKPDYAKAYSNRGVALQELKRLDDAYLSFSHAIKLQPDYAEAYYNRANVLRDMGRLHEALENHTKAIELDSGFAEAFANRGNVWQDLGKLKAAREDYRHAIELAPQYELAYTSLLMLLNYMPEIDAEECLELAKEYGSLVEGQVLSSYKNHQCLPPASKLRVGLVSGDFHSHPVGYFLESVLPILYNSSIELIAYPSSHYTDNLTKRIQPFFKSWQPIYSLQDEVAAERIFQDGVHILIDLSGHTQNHRLPLFAHKPAPIQLSWLGYFATTGITAIDYILGDPYVTPEGAERQFTEEIWRLPESRWCASRPEYEVDIAPLPALKNGYITFGCFGNYTKINDGVVKLWCEVLEAVPDSKLLLKTKQFRDQKVIDEARSRFVDLGINNDRIVIENPESRDRYFDAYNRIDITLDTFPFAGGTTTVDSLWMGVPVISLAGNSLVSRQGVSILVNTGLSDWLANEKQEYVAKAMQYAGSLRDLAELRSRMREQVLASTLFDASRFAQDFEHALWDMWRLLEDAKAG